MESTDTPLVPVTLYLGQQGQYRLRVGENESHATASFGFSLGGWKWSPASQEWVYAPLGETLATAQTAEGGWLIVSLPSLPASLT